MSNTHSNLRVQQHAKLLRYEDRQVLVFLSRNESDDLAIFVQVWVASCDHQLRATIVLQVEDDLIQVAFEALDDETIGDALEFMGVLDRLRELEAA